DAGRGLGRGAWTGRGRGPEDQRGVEAGRDGEDSGGEGEGQGARQRAHSRILAAPRSYARLSCWNRVRPSLRAGTRLLSSGGFVAPAPAKTKNLTARIRNPATLAAPLLRSKLVRPNEGPDLLERTRLVDALAAHGDRPLSVVVADAGCGQD